MKHKLSKEKKKLIFEFLRYALVGAVCAIIDMAVNYCMLFYVLCGTKDDKISVFISVAAGFICGLVANFILSNIFVFKSEEQKEKGKSLKAFLIYGIVGIIGFLITEVLTLIGTGFIGDTGIFYLLLTGFVKCVVLIWNYAGRKIFVYKGK